MKMNKELNTLKEEAEAMNREFSVLSESELADVTGGTYSMEEAEKAVQKAKAEAAALRGKRGGLTYTGENLVISLENQETPEAILTDADMAAEAVKLASQNVQEQAQQAMIAQANQSTQNVLGLLQ